MPGLDDAALPAAIADAFHARHEALYTYALRDQDVVLVNARCSVIGRFHPTGTGWSPPPVPAASARRRRIHLGAWIEVPVLRFEALGADDVPGPCIIESDTTAVLLHANDRGRFDPRGWLEISVAM